jgi:murein L,D-transpeptidase YafK
VQFGAKMTFVQNQDEFINQNISFLIMLKLKTFCLKINFIAMISIALCSCTPTRQLHVIGEPLRPENPTYTVSSMDSVEMSISFAHQTEDFWIFQTRFITLKAEKQLELWFEKGDNVYFVKSYPILAASGVAGPKLKEGDLQVPEGFYKISWLNPNSDLHLSMQVNYPNDFDKKKAQQEGRTQLGGDIFVHGKAMSLGCVAIGDEAIEEVFYMCSKIGIKNSAFLSMPHDFRKKELIPQDKIWLNELYQQLNEQVRQKYIHL